PHQHLTAFDTAQQARYIPADFLKEYILRCKRRSCCSAATTHAIHSRDLIASLRCIKHLVALFNVDTSFRSHDQRPQSSYSFLTMCQVLVIGDNLNAVKIRRNIFQRGFDHACYQRRFVARARSR
ncbi:hypothetical protein, partial [Nitrobacter winogradskyi]